MIAGGVAGTTTLLWSSQFDCSPAFPETAPFVATLQQPTGEVAFLDPAPATLSHVVTFDGAQYQLFWATPPNIVHHQALAEDGTPGPAHTLAVTGTCLDVATDGAGMTFLRVDHDGYIVDTQTGQTRLVFDNPSMPDIYDQTFYFAQQFHVLSLVSLFSIDPSSTGASTLRTLTGDLNGTREFFPTQNRLYASSFGGVVEIDAALATVRELPFSPLFPVGTLGDDLVHFETTAMDPSLKLPGHIDLIREGAWQKQVAVDSEVRLEELCTGVPPGDAR